MCRKLDMTYSLLVMCEQRRERRRRMKSNFSFLIFSNLGKVSTSMEIVLHNNKEVFCLSRFSLLCYMIIIELLLYDICA